MRVFRIEHESRGHGPYIVPMSSYECSPLCDGDCEVDKEYYRTIDLAWAVVGAHQDRYHRSPQGIQAHEFCGFNSLYALEAWFDGWLDKLFAAGYVVAEYDGVGVRTFGNGQVTFNKNLSNRLTTTTV